jgi:hypothetical protein
MMLMFGKFIDWLTLRDYEAVKKSAFRGIIGRYTRGNVAIQEGRYLTADDLTALGQTGDLAASNIRKLIQNAR